MNLLHRQPAHHNEPSFFRQLLYKTLSPTCQVANQRFQVWPVPASSTPHTLQRHVNHNHLARLIASSTFAGFIATSTIAESPSEAADLGNTPDNQKSHSAHPNGQLLSGNMNLMPQKSMHMLSCLRDQDVDNHECDIIASNTPNWTQPQSHSCRSSLSSLSLDDRSDQLASLRGNEQKLTRHAGFSPSRAAFRRSSLLPQIWRKDLVFGAVIGKGGFGKVHTGHIHGSPVAIKVVQKRRGSGIHREILQAEKLAFSLHLRHENIISILGLNLCDGLRGDALIVMELVSPRTLQSVLDDNTQVVTQADRLRFALQITKALSYLHMNDVVHLDVKPRNVLMTKDSTCKLGDFGSLTRTRRDLPREETEFTQLLGTLPYRAPELMKGCFPSNKADIFSLGITLWQLATRETPHCGANPHWLIYQVTKGNKRPDHHYTGNDSTENKYCNLYSACWDAEPDLRPSAEDVIVALNSLQQ
ncbi:hypothetical protein BsWGS_14456 [Bradybaena similaris]